MADPGFWNDRDGAQVVVGKLRALKALVEPLRGLEKDLRDHGELLEMTEDSDAASIETLRRDSAAIEKRLDALEFARLLSDEDDRLDCYLEVHAGAGGTEAADWAEMLLRMYTKWCERRGYETELVDALRNDEAGVKHATLRVAGPFAYGYLKAETGVHRLVRISPFDANARRHTSFASVDVMPDYPEEVVTIEEKDLKIDTYRAGGAGGQHVNVTDSAVRITHLPTGIVVQCQNERSQHRNRKVAMKILMVRLKRVKEMERQKELAATYSEKGEIAWGSQIRSYVLQPYQLVKDVRTEVETSNTQKVLDGDLDPFIEAFLRWDASRKSRGGGKPGAGSAA